MTEEQVIKALECCIKEYGCCNECPYDGYTCITDKGQSIIMGDALDLINRQNAEIERLKKTNERLELAFVAECELSGCLRKKEIRGEAIKDALNRAKKRIGDSHFQNYGLAIMEIIEVEKEMEGGEADA